MFEALSFKATEKHTSHAGAHADSEADPDAKADSHAYDLVGTPGPASRWQARRDSIRGYWLSP
jgi:hypothetical protein